MLCPCHESEFDNEELPAKDIPAFYSRYGLQDGDRVTVLAKGKTSGPNAAPIWKFIDSVLPGVVDWNFAAWVLFDSAGAPVGRWGFSLQDIGNASFLKHVTAALERL